MNNNRLNNEQMELGFNGRPACPSTQRPQKRLTRARWWDKAVDWKSAPQARPEQIWFPE